MRTVVDAITDQAGGTGTLTLLDSGADVVDALPWRAVHDRARRMSTVLAERGLLPGCRVGLVGETSVGLVAALQAIWLTGGAVTLMPPYGRGGPAASAEYLLAVLADARLDLVVVDDRLVAAASVMSTVTDVITLTELADEARRSALSPVHRPRRSDLALLQYTSGSTRIPRGVPVTHGHLAANIQAIKVALDHDAGHPDPTFSWLPLYHDMGLIAFLAMPMTCGCPLFLQPPSAFARRPGSWLDALSRYRIAMSGAPNFAYALVTRLLQAGADLDLSAVRCLVSGGEPVDAAMMARFTEAAARYGLAASVLVPAYGLAEATLAVTVSPVRQGLLVDLIDQATLETAGRAEPGTRPLVRVGRPVRDVAVRIVDRITGDPVADRVVGHVQARGPSVIGHYWGETAPPAGSWLPTGDLGYLTDGELVVCGREKDVLFAAGRNVFPQDVEVVAAEVAGVRPGGAVAFGLPHPRGDRLVVAVEARGHDAGRLRRDVAVAVLEEVGLAPDVTVVPYGSLPKTSSGKLRRAEARRRYEAGDLRPEAVHTKEMENR